MDMDIQAPTSYLNMRAALDGDKVIFTAEHPLYSDSHITGQTEHGPYKFLHTVPVQIQGLVQPILVLRVDWHYDQSSVADFSETKDDLYHGGTPTEEIAALASLAMGVRFRAGVPSRTFENGGGSKGLAESMVNTPYACPEYKPDAPLDITSSC